jgi:phosphohistidine swiveling domain-containing protein
MKLKRIFKKFYTRDIPLFLVELWHEGEFRGLRKISDGKSHFNPLFIYQSGRAVEVFYDMNNPSTDDRPIIKYFLRYPEKFEQLGDRYLDESRQLADLVRTGEKNFTKLYRLYLSLWPKLTLIMLLGGRYNKSGNNRVFSLAYGLRKKTDKVFYMADQAIINSVKALRPAYSKYLNFLSFKEIRDNKLPEKAELQKRKKGFIYFGGKIYTDLNIKSFEKHANIKITVEQKRTSIASLIKGSIAMKGKAKGRVKIVFDFSKSKKVKIGDILVAPMTTPDFISAMKRASAFITDEGGITCHAAIVAREMKKPCIIGTKIATKVLHDGDLVEVDANKGEVRIIRKK